MSLRLSYVSEELMRMLSEGITLKSLGKCALELIVARGEIEQARYVKEEKSEALKRLKQLESAVVLFSLTAITKLDETPSYSRLPQQYKDDKYFRFERKYLDFNF